MYSYQPQSHRPFQSTTEIKEARCLVSSLRMEPGANFRHVITTIRKSPIIAPVLATIVPTDD